jgi:hypothetical protein
MTWKEEVMKALSERNLHEGDWGGTENGGEFWEPESFEGHYKHDDDDDDDVSREISSTMCHLTV